MDTIRRFWAGALLLLLALPLRSQHYESVRVLAGHDGPVQNIRFSPDGKLLASGGVAGEVMLWDVGTGNLARRIDAHAQRVNEVTFSPSGKLLASASYDGSVKVWEVATGTLVGTYRNKDLLLAGFGSRIVSFVAFDARSERVFFGGDGGALMMARIGKNVAGTDHEAEVLYSFVYTDASGRRHADRLTGGALAPDRASAVVSIRNRICGIDLATGTLKMEARYAADWFNDVVAGPGPMEVSTWSEDGRVTIWNYATGDMVRQIQAGDRDDYSAASFNSAGTLMVTGASAHEANIWEVATGRHIALLKGHTAIVRLARFSPAENLVATGSYDGTIRIWKVEEPDVPVPTPKPPVPTPLPKPADPPVATGPAPKPSPTPEPDKEELAEEEMAVGKTFTLKSIQFEQGQHRLLPESYPVLDRMAALLRKYPNMVIQIEGHTDNVGEASKNYTLSYRRVQTVKNYLLDKGNISEERIHTLAYGEAKPIASNEQEETRKLNRRVEVRILKL